MSKLCWDGRTGYSKESPSANKMWRYMLIIWVYVFYLPSLFHQNCIVFHTYIENTENAITGLKMMNEDWISDYHVKLFVNHTQLGAFLEYIIPEDKKRLDLEIWIRDVISGPVTRVVYAAFTCSGNVSNQGRQSPVDWWRPGFLLVLTINNSKLNQFLMAPWPQFGPIFNHRLCILIWVSFFPRPFLFLPIIIPTLFILYKMEGRIKT